MATSEPVRRSAAALLRLTCRPEVTGMDQVPAEGPFIMASNHLSFFDSVILQALAPRPVHFFAKEEYFTGAGVRGRAQRWFFESVGSVPVRRGEQAASVAALESLVGLLESGQGVGIYPEGTRSHDGRLYRAKIGVARLVMESGAPVIPIAMINTDVVQPLGTPFPAPWRQKGKRVKTIFGEPLDFSEYKGRTGDRVAAREISDRIIQAIQELSHQEYVDVYAADARRDLERGAS